MLRLAVVLVCMLVGTADAEPWYRGKYGTNRVLHLSIAVGGGALYAATDFVEARWAPTECKWCEPTGLDTSVRDALRWNDDRTPRRLSHVAAFAVAPLSVAGLLLIHTPPSWADVIDNLVPIGESMVIVLWLTRPLKMLVGRQRPYAYTGIAIDDEDNLSFPSGHTSRAFAAVTAAAVVAHVRDYPSEPYIIATGAVVGLGAGYLRMAADKHYITDVLAGAALGVGTGLAVPWLMRRDVAVVPTQGGVALAGTW